MQGNVFNVGEDSKMNKNLPVPALSGWVDGADGEDWMGGQMFTETVKYSHSNPWCQLAGVEFLNEFFYEYKSSLSKTNLI